MTMDGGCDPMQIDHENTADPAHIDLKAKLKDRRGTYVFIPHDGQYDFTNDFSAIPLEDAPFFFCGIIPTVRHEGVEPDEWDKGGAMASYSAGSEVAELRNFKRDLGTQRRGPKRKNLDEYLVDGNEADLQPPPPPGDFMERAVHIDRVPWEDYRSALLEVREAAKNIKRWGCGAKSRGQWKITPISVQTILDEGEADATLLDSPNAKEANRVVETPLSGGSPVKTRKTKLPHDLRRYTVNSHPALARALAKVLKYGDQAEVMGFMDQTLPSVIRKFEKVTGRRVVGASIHWDSNLPHWNLWHTGLERVLYRKGKGKDRERFRRTAMNLGSSGPGLRAWRRVELAYQRLGREFCQYTAVELRKEEARLGAAQGRMPGDWVINEVADEELEKLLVNAGYEREVEEGFNEFVNNEDERYAAGMAGRLALEDRRAMAEEINRLRDEAAQIESLKATIELLKVDTAKEKAAGEELAVKLETSTARVEEMRLEAAGLHAQARTDAESRSELNVRITELDAEVAQLQKGLEDERLAREATEKQSGQNRTQLTAERDKLKSRSESLEADVAGLRTNKTGLQKKVASLEKGVASLEREKVKLKSSNETLAEKLKKLDLARDPEGDSEEFLVNRAVYKQFHESALFVNEQFLKLEAILRGLMKFILQHEIVQKTLSSIPAVWDCLHEVSLRVNLEIPTLDEISEPPKKGGGEGRADPRVDGTKEGSPTEPEDPT